VQHREKSHIDESILTYRENYGNPIEFETVGEVLAKLSAAEEEVSHRRINFNMQWKS